jgi:hypothetical protein
VTLAPEKRAKRKSTAPPFHIPSVLVDNPEVIRRKLSCGEISKAHFQASQLWKHASSCFTPSENIGVPASSSIPVAAVWSGRLMNSI